MTDNISDMPILAIIPARSGSKGLSGKNIIECAGKPLIAWSIEAALKSKYITQVLVTTDAEEIAKVAKNYGAWVPFLRHQGLAQDDSSITDVVKDVLCNADVKMFNYKIVVLLQPTSPLRTAQHIDDAVELYSKLKSSALDTLVSVYQEDSKGLLLFGINSDGGYLYSHSGLDLKNPRRQNLPKCYAPNGAIFIAQTGGFSGFYSKNTIPFIMDKDISVDIDYVDDLRLAEKMLAE